MKIIKHPMIIFLISISVLLYLCNLNIVHKPEIMVNMDTVVTRMLEYDINNYFKNNFPKSKISAKEISRVCVKYKLEPLFLLSMAHVESHYGTAGKARRTNSVFNVGAWDDGSTKNRYAAPDSSIEDYAILITENYLNEKTVDELLKPGSFKSIYGYRYAKEPEYEYHVKFAMKLIKSKSKIKKLAYYYKKVNDYLIYNKKI